MSLWKAIGLIAAGVLAFVVFAPPGLVVLVLMALVLTPYGLLALGAFGLAVCLIRTLARRGRTPPAPFRDAKPARTALGAAESARQAHFKRTAPTRSRLP